MGKDRFLRQVRAGLTILLPSEEGGYSELGWDATSAAAVEPVAAPSAGAEEGTSGDPNSSGSSPALTIAAHTNHVCTEPGSIVEAVRRTD